MYMEDEGMVGIMIVQKGIVPYSLHQAGLTISIRHAWKPIQQKSTEQAMEFP